MLFNTDDHVARLASNSQELAARSGIPYPHYRTVCLHQPGWVDYTPTIPLEMFLQKHRDEVRRCLICTFYGNEKGTSGFWFIRFTDKFT
jgi:hypothetical protein